MQRIFMNTLFNVEASILRYIIGAISDVEIARRYIKTRDGIETRVTLVKIAY